MTTRGSTIFVEAEEAGIELPSLLKAVADEGKQVQICRGGKPVAVLQPISEVADPLTVHPELKASAIAEDAFSPVSEDDWPEECR